MDDGAPGQTSLRDLPELLDPDGVDLGEPPGVEAETRHELLGQAAASPFREDGHLGPQVDTGLVVGLPLAVLVDALVAGAHSHDSVALVQHLGPGKPGEHVDASRFRLGRHPLDELVEADDEVPVVLERRRHHRKADLAAARQEVHPVVAHGRRDGRPLLDEIGDQLPQRDGIEDGPREAVGARLESLLHDHDRGVEAAGGRGVVAVEKVLESDRGCQASRPRSHHEHIGLEDFTLGHQLDLATGVPLYPFEPTCSFTAAVSFGRTSKTSPTIP